jgi:WD40 repeat protein
VAVSANGNKIVTGSERGNVCLWDSATGEKISSMPLSEPGIAAVAISLEGQRIAFGSWDNTIQLWDLSCDKALLPLRGHEDEITSVAFSPDGRRIVSSSSDKTVRLWDAGSAVEGIPSLQGPKLKSWALSTDDVVPLLVGDDATPPGDGCPSLPWRESSNLPLAFSSDGTWIASGSFDQSIRLWDAASGTELLSPLRGHRDYVISLAFSQDRKYIASGSFDKDVRVWNTTNRETLPLVGHKGSVLAVAFSPDGRQVVSGSSDNTIMVWFAFTGTQSLPPLQGHQKTITAVVFSPDGKRIISGSEDKTIRVWDAKLGTEILPPLRGHSGPISSVAFSHGGRVISGSFDNTIRLWDISSGHYDRLEVSIHSNHKFGHHIVLTTDGWIVCLTGTGCTYLSKLPSMVLIDSVAASVSSRSSITIGTFSGELFIMHFPSGL